MKANSPLTTPINRRNFLRLAALVGTSAAESILLGGCSSEQSSSPQDITQNDANSDSATQAEQNSPSGSQTLIAVFSWSGNTLQVAEHIHELIQGDFFRIEPATPYTDNYNELLDIAQQEQNDDTRPALSSTIENWDNYSTIYLGYPIWWYDAPQIIKTFLDTYPLSGKTLIPFCTSGESSIDQTLPSIESLASGASIATGITLDGDSVESQLDQVDSWLGDLGLR